MAPPPTTPYADFCVAVRVPLSPLSPVFRDTTQISRGKFDRLQHTTAGSTLCALDGCGLRSAEPARPALTPHTRFLFIGSCLCSTLLSDGSSRQPPLRFASPSVPSTWAKDFHLLAIEHARHTLLPTGVLARRWFPKANGIRTYERESYPQERLHAEARSRSGMRGCAPVSGDPRGRRVLIHVVRRRRE